MAQQIMNLTSTHEDVGSIPGLGTLMHCEQDQSENKKIENIV